MSTTALAAADAAWRERAAVVIPSGASTGSKRPDALYGDRPGEGPTHFTRAAGCRLVTAGGTTLIDCTMALGSVALGYADPAVTDAVSRAASSGNVAGLSHVLEVEIAERLCEVIPCAERVRFLKSGAEGVAAAVRVARTHTARSTVVGCGYFGWLDWWSDAPGVPAGAHADFRPVPFDDASALEAAVRSAGSGLAAIVIEPVIERMPSREWLLAARRLADEAGSVLIFDEIKTGFRLRTGGAQQLFGVTPDLAVFGKAMANGFPLAALVGRAQVMDAAHRTWISSTLAGESVALAAAGAVLDRHGRENVCDELERIGAAMRAAVDAAIGSTELSGVRTAGIPQMWFMRFDDAAMPARFVTHMLREGVLVKRGAYNFAGLAHDADVVASVAGAARAALGRLAGGG